MWLDYFGPKAHIYGVDIEPACRAYETENIKILIGDQGDRVFWRDFRREVPVLDIVIDDGSHNAEHQIVSLEELLPFLRPGGVYLCEDVLHSFNQFRSYLHGLDHKLNDNVSRTFHDVIDCTPFQSAIDSIHLYPFVAVIEKNSHPLTQLKLLRRGTQWQSF